MDKIYNILNQKEKSYITHHKEISDDKEELRKEINSLRYKYNKYNCYNKLKKDLSDNKKYLNMIKKKISSLQNDSDDFDSNKNKRIESLNNKIKKEPSNNYYNFEFNIMRKNNFENQKILNDYKDIENEILEKISKIINKINKSKIKAEEIKTKILKLEDKYNNFYYKTNQFENLNRYLDTYKFKTIDIEPKINFYQQFIKYCNNIGFVNSNYGEYSTWHKIDFQTGKRYKLGEINNILKYSEKSKINHIFKVPRSFIINQINGNVGNLSLKTLEKYYNNEYISEMIPPDINEHLKNTVKINLDINQYFTGRLNIKNKLDLSNDYEVFKNCLKILNGINLKKTLIIGLTKYISSFTAACLTKDIDIKFHIPEELFYSKKRIDIINMLQDITYMYKNRNIKNKLGSQGLLLCDYEYKENDKVKLPINYKLLPQDLNMYSKVIILFDNNYNDYLIYNINKNLKIKDKKYRKIKNYFDLIIKNKSYYGIDVEYANILRNKFEFKKK